MDAPSTDIQQILEARAAALAQPLTDASIVDGEVQLVVLALGDEQYGVDSQWVEEVQPSARITPVPGIPGYWRGLVNLRGRLFPVLDLRAYLASIGAVESSATAPTTGQQIVVAAAAGLRVGLLVDAVPEVRRVSRTAFGPSLIETQGYLQALLPSITPDLLVLLDLNTLLRDRQLFVEATI